MSPAPGAHAWLSEGEVRLVGLIPWASNDTYLVEVADGATVRRAVYKPRDGEAPLWDFPSGTLYAREVAAYLVSELLGWSLVPATVVRDGPLGTGSLQEFVAFDPQEHYLTLAEKMPDAFRPVAAFDVVVNNADRKSGHCLLEQESGRIRLVDHGVTFHAEYKLRTVIWEFAGEPLGAPVAEGLERLLGALPDRELDALLAPQETVALAARTRALLEAGVFPHPGPGRPYPWPPV